MSNKGRMPMPIPAQHQQRHHQHHHPVQAGILQHHPDPYGPRPGMHRPLPPGGAFGYDMMMPPPPEIIERKLEKQHGEIKKLALENQRLAASHNSLRHELATSQHELQRLQAHMEGVKGEEEQKIRVMTEKMAKMEPDLKSGESIKSELQKSHAEAQSLVSIRQDLISKVQSMSQDLQRTVTEAQQLPGLVTELDSLRQEYQNYRASYEYERKLRLEHYESLQIMEKNYVSMVREMEKLRAQLTYSTGVAYNSTVNTQKENDSSAQAAQVHAMQSGQAANNPGPSPNSNPNPNPNSQYDPTQAQVAYYGTAQPAQPYYGTTQAQQNIYAAQQYMYGTTQVPVNVNPYGISQVPGQQQVSNPYGSVQYGPNTQGQNRK